jgi:CHAT domain-containing protein
MRSRFAPHRVVGLLGLSGLVLVGAGCGTRAAKAASASQLDRSFFDVRFSSGRLSAQPEFHSCAGGDSVRVRSTCVASVGSSRAFNRLAAASRSARQRLDADSSADALHDAALLSLRLRDSVRTGLDDAVRFLSRARAADSGNATLLNDLAVVELELGAREQSIRPPLVALDAADRAVAADSTFLPALFNRALSLERLHLLATAQVAWRRYLTVERDASWKREARDHLEAVTRESMLAPLPQGGRDSVFRLLGAWGHAIARHDDAKAAAMLEAARRVVATLDTVRSDQSLRFALALLDSQSRAAQRSPAGRRTLERLAAAHADLNDGYRPYLDAKYEEAIGPLRRAEGALRELGSAAGGWASLYLASTELNLQRYTEADERLLRVIAEASPEQPALAGKAVWTRGVIHVRRGNFETATNFYRDAAPYMARANEPDNEGVVSFLIAESLSAGGQFAAGRIEAFRALRLLAPYRKLGFLRGSIDAVTTLARADSLPFAALSVMDEMMSVALEVDNPYDLVMTHRARALGLAAIGRRDAAFDELANGLEAIEPLKEDTKARFRAYIEFARGQIDREQNPRRALPILAGVATEYRRLANYSYESAALYEAAMAARDAGDSVKARGMLAEAIAQIERQQATFDKSEDRAALYETVDNIFDAIIDLELRAGHADSAFSYLERERAAARLPMRPSSLTGASDGPSLETMRRHLSDDMLFVEYALLDDRTIVWTASRRGVNQHDIRAPRGMIASLVERFHKEASIPAPRDNDARSRLFDLLIGPLANDLEGVQQLVVVSDRELARLPFAALWDRARKQYVVERYRVRTEPSGAFFLAAQALRPKKMQRRTALVVGNPALDAASTPLAPLPGAEAEARQVADLYRPATLFVGANARRDTVEFSLRRAPSVFHFAGHAVFNEDRPELSYLALAPPRGGIGTGALEAREIAQLRLSNLELVVLSACQTLSSRPTRTGAVAGLASSFLQAGAPGTISTVWDVSDDVTAPLLAAFHRRFADGQPAADALRDAQLDALRAGSDQRAAPAFWAGFVYAGP